MSDQKPIEANDGSELIQQQLSQLVKRAGSDGQLKERLVNDTESVLQENGVEIPPGTKPRVVIDKDSVSFEFLSQTTDDVELTENAMSAVVGGTPKSTSSSSSPQVYLKYTFTQVFVTSVSM